ncbi:MAG: hypothetical protein U0992_21030 [Planctomycetaceae bacterium]
MPGLSENIQVVSIIDRFLEHARIFAFHHGGEERVLISSADWMPAHLDRQPLLIPVEDPACRQRLLRAPRSLLQRQYQSAPACWLTVPTSGCTPTTVNRCGHETV